MDREDVKLMVGFLEATKHDMPSDALTEQRIAAGYFVTYYAKYQLQPFFAADEAQAILRGEKK